MTDPDQTEKPTAWKPMDSAPKDGRWILVRRSKAFFEFEAAKWDAGMRWVTHSAYCLTSDFDAWTDIPA